MRFEYLPSELKTKVLQEQLQKPDAPTCMTGSVVLLLLMAFRGDVAGLNSCIFELTRGQMRQYADLRHVAKEMTKLLARAYSSQLALDYFLAMRIDDIRRYLILTESMMQDRWGDTDFHASLHPSNINIVIYSGRRGVKHTQEDIFKGALHVIMFCKDCLNALGIDFNKVAHANCKNRSMQLAARQTWKRLLSDREMGVFACIVDLKWTRATENPFPGWDTFTYDNTTWGLFGFLETSKHICDVWPAW